MAIRTINGKAWAVCHDCGKIVRFDKPVFGSLHICSTSEEREAFKKEIAAQVAAAEQMLSASKPA